MIYLTLQDNKYQNNIDKKVIILKIIKYITIKI